MEDFEEGARCPRLGCPGKLEDMRDSGCSCHISPPCHHCVNTYLHCGECDWEGDYSAFEDEWEGMAVPAGTKQPTPIRILPPSPPPAPVVMLPRTSIGEWKEERREAWLDGRKYWQMRCGAQSVAGHWIWSTWWYGFDGDAESELSSLLREAYNRHMEATEKRQAAIDKAVAAYPTGGVMVTGAPCQ